MLSRRELMSAGVAGMLYPGAHLAAADAPVRGASAETAAPTGEQQADRDGQREIARSIDRIDGTMRNALLSNSLAHGMVGKVRASMELFFKTNTKFPDFMEIGIGVFMELYDWHVKNRQQLTVTRGADGRYWMQFMFTTMLVRHEVDSMYLGIPYDKA